MLLLLGLAACPPASGGAEGSPQKPASACTKEGQNCEFSPGKIGLCSSSGGECEGGACLVCVSLH